MNHSNIKITKTSQTSIDKVDFDDIKFGHLFSDHMFMVDYEDGAWKDPQIIPTQELSLHPGNMALHYGQSIFEGMKATKDTKGNPMLFRPEMHAKRLNASAHRMCMPEIPEALFLDGLRTLISLDSAWIPPHPGTALYVRPFMFALDNHIGVRESHTYRFMILTLPAGKYYPRPVGLLAFEDYIRAAVGGVGEAKAAGNYAAAMYPTKLAKEAGYDQVLWLDAIEKKYIQEVGTMNIYFVIDGTVVTPETDGAILKGITRDTILQVLKSKGIPVEERKLSIDEVVAAHENGTLEECFGSGTAAVIAQVNRIAYQGKDYNLATEFKVATMLKATIDGLRNGTVKDEWGWTELLPVEAATIA